MIIVPAEWEAEQFGNIIVQSGRCPGQEHVAGLEAGTLHQKPRLLVIARCGIAEGHEGVGRSAIRGRGGREVRSTWLFV